MLFSLFTLLTPYLMAPETDPAGAGGGGTSGDPAGDPPDKKVIDQEALNAAIKSAEKSAAAKVKATEAKLAALEATITQLVEKLNQVPEPKPPTTEEGKIEALQRKFQREAEEQNKKLAEVQARAEKAERARLEGIRDRLLDDALVAAGCNDMTAGRRYFLPVIGKSDEDGNELEEWVVKSASGKLVDIQTGVMDGLPKSLRGPSTTTGGAGTTGGGSKAKDKDQIKALEAEIEELKKKAHQQGDRNQQTVTLFTTKKRELEALKKKAAAGSK